MKPKAGFHFEPRNKLPSFADHSRIKLVVDPEVRPAYIISVHPPKTGIELRLNPAFLLTYLISSPNLSVSSLSYLLLFWLIFFLDDLFLLGMYVIDLLRLD